MMRLPAEWERQDAVLVAWPHASTDWNYMLEEAQECYCRLIESIARHARAVVIAPDTREPRRKLAHLAPDRVVYFDVATNDTWTRDYGAITTVDDDGRRIVNDFGFNGWGGKFVSDLDNAVTGKMHKAGLIPGLYNDERGFILEGGSIESDGNGTILTTSSCLLTPTRNPMMSLADIERKLAETLGARKVLWLNSGEIIGDDTDGHIDTIARLAPNNTILYCGPGWCEESDPQSRCLSEVADELSKFTNAENEPFSLIELPMPAPIYDKEDGHRLPATYANFLIINDAVLMPTYGQPRNDQNAKMALQVAFPNYIIEEIDCRALIRQHGSLHCATMQLHING